jgi:flagellar L-ring protein precursor FlgH
MSTRTSDAGRAALLASLVLSTAFGAAPAGARKPKVVESYAATPPAPLGPPAVATGAIFQVQDGYAGLYEGVRAHRKGDPLTIVLVEKTAASKSAGSKLDSSGGFGLTPPSTGPLSKLFKGTDIATSGNRGFNGTGTADQANSLSGEVSVIVADVYSNGTMLVQGQKSVTLNRGDEFLKIKGIVRIADISDDNRVLSTRVADAQISYTGKGDVARASRQGWLSRFFSVVSPF